MSEEIEGKNPHQEGFVEKPSDNEGRLKKATKVAKWTLTPLPAVESTYKGVKGVGRSLFGYMELIKRKRSQQQFSSYNDLVKAKKTDEAQVSKSIHYLRLKSQWSGMGSIFSILVCLIFVVFVGLQFILTVPFAVMLWAIGMRAAYLADCYEQKNLDLYSGVSDFIQKRGLVRWVWQA